MDLAYNCEILKFSDQEVLVSTLSTQDFQLSNVISVFPNPTVDNVTIKINDINFKSIEVSIYDLSGRIIHNSNHTSNKFKISMLPFSKGVYYLKFRRDNNKILSVGKKILVM